MTYDDKQALTSAFEAVAAAEKAWAARYSTCDTRRGVFFAEDTPDNLQKYLVARKAEDDAFREFVRHHASYHAMLRARRRA